MEWLSDNWIEVFGALAGIVYVFLEIRQNIWLWPVGIVTSSVYIYVFFGGKLYADMGLQGYYLIISCVGLYWWAQSTSVHRSFSEGAGHRAKGKGNITRGEEDLTLTDNSFLDGGKNGLSNRKLKVSRINLKTGMALSVVFAFLFLSMWLILERVTDSPVPGWDSFITSLSIIATWMLARKIYEHWYLWIVVNITAVVLFFTRELYPTVILYFIYCAMSLAGLVEWKKSLIINTMES